MQGFNDVARVNIDGNIIGISEYIPIYHPFNHCPDAGANL